MFSDDQRAGPRETIKCASMGNLTGVAFLYGKLHGVAYSYGEFHGGGFASCHSPNPSTALTRPQLSPPPALTRPQRPSGGICSAVLATTVAAWARAAELSYGWGVTFAHGW